MGDCSSLSVHQIWKMASAIYINNYTEICRLQNVSIPNGSIVIKDSVNSVTICEWEICLQCFDAVGWAAGRASGL